MLAAVLRDTKPYPSLPIILRLVLLEYSGFWTVHTRALAPRAKR